MVRRGRGLIGLGIVIAIHGAIDSLAMLYQYLGRLEFLAVTEILLITVAIILALRIYRKALSDVQQISTQETTNSLNVEVKQ